MSEPSKTPITDKAAVQASTGFGADDYSDDYVPVETCRALELAANGLRDALEETWDELRSFGDNPDAPDSTREMVNQAIAALDALKGAE